MVSTRCRLGAASADGRGDEVNAGLAGRISDGGADDGLGLVVALRVGAERSVVVCVDADLEVLGATGVLFAF